MSTSPETSDENPPKGSNTLSPPQAAMVAPSSGGGSKQYLSPGALPAFRLGSLTCSSAASTASSADLDLDEDEGCFSAMSISPASSPHPSILRNSDTHQADQVISSHHQVSSLCAPEVEEICDDAEMLFHASSSCSSSSKDHQRVVHIIDIPPANSYHSNHLPSKIIITPPV